MQFQEQLRYEIQFRNEPNEPKKLRWTKRRAQQMVAASV